jgi:uncharacterized protein
MYRVGEYNNLKVCRESPHGLYLTDGTSNPETGWLNEVLLPEGQCPDDALLGHSLKVFVYTDSEDRPVATREKPTAVVGEFAYLTCVGVSHSGAFFDWGLQKDLFCPFREHVGEVQEGSSYIVRVYVDEKTSRVACSMRLNRFLSSDTSSLTTGDKVRVLIIQRTPDLVIAIINQQFRGAFFPDEWFAEFKVGSKGTAYIKRIRPDDGRVALSLRPQGYEAVLSEKDKILSALSDAGGMLRISDKSSPELILEMFGLSKSSFKKVLGNLYREGEILIFEDRIELK